jgi:5-methylcytosine-specific restriction protein B
MEPQINVAKEKFRKFLAQKVNRESTIRQYLAWMYKIQKWFIEKKIVDEDFNIWTETNQIKKIQIYLDNENQSGWKATNKPIKNWMSSPWNAWVNFNNNVDIKTIEINEEEIEMPFDKDKFTEDLKNSGLIFSKQIIQRFLASLCTKPFVICSGLSGSGKTKLAQAFALWICEDKSQYEIVPVGADWTNREPLLGFPNALNSIEYVLPENGVLDLIIRANENYVDKKQTTKPFFLILDEMNLSHVERYFADFLSSMESNEPIALHKISNEKNNVPNSILLSKNLFIIGTVNIDETTYMFSPKVLDRANTIEFRITESNLEEFIENDIPLKMELLNNEGANMAQSFIEIVLQENEKGLHESKKDLILFFNELKKTGAEFGYRTANEIGRLMFMLNKFGNVDNNRLDIAIMQKLLPKLHGSRSKLSKILPVLGGFCMINNANIKDNYFDKFIKDEINEKEIYEDDNIKYKISFEKICRMYKNAIENGFASYAEA